MAESPNPPGYSPSPPAHSSSSPPPPPPPPGSSNSPNPTPPDSPSSTLSPLPQNFPGTLDLTRLHVLELGREYVLHHFSLHGSVKPDAVTLYMEKVILLPLDTANEFVLLTIHVSGKLTMFRTGDPRWEIIHDMPSPYDDVILYNGEFYAVDGTGRCVIMGLDMGLSLVAESVFGGDKKYLVESLGELLLVDMYLSIDVDDDNEDRDDEEIAEIM